MPDLESDRYKGIICGRKNTVAVVGAGVIGLTNAIMAQDAGYQVTIYSDLPTSKTTSMVAGATFAPYSVPLTETVLDMTARGWGKFADLSKKTETTGVRTIDYWEIESNPVDPKTKPYLPIMDHAQFYERPDVPGGYGMGVKYGTFMIDMPIYLKYLAARFKRNDGSFIRQRFSNMDELAQLDGDIVFNCTGLGAKALTNDENMTAIKGQLAIARYRPDLTEAIKHDGFYAFPQPQTGRMVLGGTTVENFDPSIEPGTTQAILNANKRILPDLKESDVYQSLVGLRPYRRGDVRVEVVYVDGKPIAIESGHGGAGVTLSWGSAELAFNKLT